MIDETLLLFERAVVLLVDDDQAQVDEGQEQGRPRPDHDIAPTGDHGFPHLAAAWRGDAGMPFGRSRAEPGRDPLDQGLGQGDLGQEDQDLGGRIGAQNPRDRLQIGLGLARARDPVQQEGTKAAADRPFGQGRRRRRLVAVQRGGGVVRVGRIEGGLGGDLDDLQHAFVDQSLDHAGRNPGRPRQIGARHHPLAQRLQQPITGRGGAGRQPVADTSDPAFRPGARRPQPLQRRRRHLARRRQGPAPGPFDEIDDAGGERRVVQPGIDRFQPPVRSGGLEHLGHDPAHQARPQGHGDLIATRQAQSLGNLVVEGFRHRQGNEDRGDFHRNAPSAMKPSMKLFLDTADVAVIKDMVPTGMVDGVTTNPSLIAKSGRNIAEVIAEICALVEGPISAEAVSLDFETMVKEGDKLAAIAPNVVVKLPLTWDGLRACRVFTDKGIKTNVTLCFSAAQALLAAKAGATFVSPFVGRLEDNGADGIALLEEIRVLYDVHGFETQILAASLRNVAHVAAAAVAGSDAATFGADTFKALVKHPLTDKGLDAFMADWGKTGQSIL
jgi:transaldolase